MDLINKIYNQQENKIDSEKPELVISNLDEENFTSILHNTYLFDDDLRYPEVKNGISLIFEKLGLSSKDYVLLGDMMVYNSRFNSKKIGSVAFNYLCSFNSDYLNTVITYYLNGELFDGNDKRAFGAGIKIGDGNTSLYYFVTHSRASLVKYEIKLDNGFILTREFSNNEVFFIFENNDHRFMIKINRKNDSDNYILDNEEMILEYLMKIENFDIDKICDKISELSFEGDKSKCSEITLCESIKMGNRWKEVNLLVLRKGNTYEFTRTVDNKVITINEFGDWKYCLDDELTEMSITSGDVVNYNVASCSEEIMDDYMDGLFQYDVSKAQCEVEDVKRLIREKYTVKRDS